MTSLPQHSQRETGTDARSRHAFPWGRRRNTAGNQDHVRTGDWETGTNLSSREETNHKANSRAGCTNKGVELRAEEEIPAQLLGLSRAAARATVALTRDMWLHSTHNQLVLLVQDFMSAAPSAAFQGKKVPCGKLPLYSTDVMGKKEQRAAQGWRTARCRPGRERRMIQTLLTNTKQFKLLSKMRMQNDRRYQLE